MPTEIKNKLDLENCYAERRGTYIHYIDKTTLATVAIVSDENKDHPQELIEVTLNDGTTCLVQRSIKPAVTSTYDVPFSAAVVDRMCQEVLEGKGISDICGQPGFPTYVTFSRWRRQHTWIDEALARARADRAEKSRDEVMKLAAAAVSTKDPINATQLKIQAHQWSAGIDDPGKYSPKAKIEAAVTMPTQIIIQTGIDRTPELDERDVTNDKNSEHKLQATDAPSADPQKDKAV